MNHIKHTLLLVPLLLVGAGAFCQDDAIGRFFGKYVDDPRFSVVSVSPKMFRLLSKAQWDTIPSDLRETVTQLHSFRMLTTETTPAVFFKEALTLIDRKEYEELITVRSGDGTVRFMTKEQGGVVKELLMLSVDDSEFLLMSFVGDIDLDRLSRLSTEMGIKGMDQLKNVKRNK